MSSIKALGTLPLDLTGIPDDARLYMGLSGGLDSSYMAWRLLDAGYSLFLHCCEFHVPGGRHWKENEAQDAVLEWFVRQGLTNFEVHRTTVDLGSFSAVMVTPEDQFHPDYTREMRYFLWAMVMFLEDPRCWDINHFVSPANADDGELPPTELAGMNQYLSIHISRQLRGHTPKAEYSKAEFLADMPLSLIRCCWSCRFPDGDEPCHKCHACGAVDTAFDELGI